jgi:hypothetical protein
MAAPSTAIASHCSARLASTAESGWVGA